MEITQRADLGSDLYAPKSDDAGRPYWSYNLVTAVERGDIVLHWHKTLVGEPAIVGWSRAAGPLEETTIVWQARGTSGRGRGPSGAEPAWRHPLEDYAPLLEPVGQDALRAAEDELRAAHDALVAQHGSPLYFPFAFSDRRPIRTAQGYLVKVPRAVFDAMPELDVIPRAGATKRRRVRQSTKPTRSRRLQDPVLRRAIERHAVALAIAHYEAAGYVVEDTGDRTFYDLEVTKGDETRRIEVKGSTLPVASIELTKNEVDSARDFQPTDLFVVGEISWWRNPDGSIGTDGGSQSVRRGWSPEPTGLTPLTFRYDL